MKTWEKILFIFFLFVILAVFWYGMRVATKGRNMTQGKEIRVTQSMDSGGRVSKED